MKLLQLNREEAIQLLQDDADDEIREGEIDHEKAKHLRHIERSAPPKKESEKGVKRRTYKKVEEKVLLFQSIEKAIRDIPNAEIAESKPETQIKLKIGEMLFTVKVVKNKSW